MEVIQVCLEGVINSCYLALHYFRKNANRSGKIVSTSSMAGLYPSTGLPLYTAAKHGVSSGTSLIQRDDVDWNDS